jgi:hypothetical protein
MNTTPCHVIAVIVVAGYLLERHADGVVFTGTRRGARRPVKKSDDPVGDLNRSDRLLDGVVIV